MRKYKNPKTLLKHLNSEMPSITSIAKSPDGFVDVFDCIPIIKKDTDFPGWEKRFGNTSVTLSKALVENLVWKSENWEECLILINK